MKTAILILAIIILQLDFIIAQDEILKDKYQSKIEGYTKMKNTGSTLTILGAATTIAGTILFVNGINKMSSDEYDPYGSDPNTEGDAEFVLGFILIDVGLPCFITGIVLNSVGARKSKEYNQKLNNLSLGFKYRSENKGVTLVYRF